MNPGFSSDFKYTFLLPESVLLDSLYLVTFMPRDMNNPQKGFSTAWKIRIKDKSADVPEEGLKMGLKW